MYLYSYKYIFFIPLNKVHVDMNRCFDPRQGKIDWPNSFNNRAIILVFLYIYRLVCKLEKEDKVGLNRINNM